MKMSNQTSYASNLTWLSNEINNYFYIISMTIGVPCNMMSIFIFSRLMRNKTNMGFFGICQSIIDIFVLVYIFLISRSTYLFHINFSNTSDTSCRVLTYLRRVVLHVSSWMTVLTTFDRVVFILYGHRTKFNFMKSKRYLAAIILVILPVILILDTPNLFFYINKSKTCNTSLLALISSDIISILLRTYLPFLVMITLNLIMLRKIFKLRTPMNQTCLSRKEYHFTVAVMVYDAYFFVLNFPLSIYYIFNDINTFSDSFVNNTLFTAQYSLVSTFTVDLSLCIQTFSFFTYLFFNKLFKREFLHLIQRVFCVSSMNIKNTTN